MARPLVSSRPLRLQRRFLAEASALSQRLQLRCLRYDRPSEIEDAHGGETGRIVEVAGNAFAGTLAEV